jgi:ATP/ADP translocase/HEAT repeat protein
MKSPRHLLNRIFDLHQHEVRRVLLMAAYLLLIIASYSTAKAVRDSLFVTKIGPSQLPYMYLGIAGAMGLVSLVYSRAVNRIGLRRLIRTTSLIVVSNLLLFWVLFRNDSAVWFYVLYIWVSLFGAITASQVWLLATNVFNPREARRAFAWIAVGGILGGILGGGMTNVLARWLGTESLILVCAAMVATTIVILEKIGPLQSAEKDESSEKDPEVHYSTGSMLGQIRQSRHLSMLVLLLGVAVIVEAFVDYEYKSVAKQSFSSKDDLTAFFGTITFYFGVLALLFQMVLTTRILKRFGVGWAILLLPAGLLAASVVLALRPVLWAAAALQLVDGAFSYSIHRSGMELLYLPIPTQTRNAVKGFIDMFVDRFGRAIGGVLLLLATAGMALSVSSLSLIVCGLAAAWIAMAVVMKREYLHSFRLALDKNTIEPEALQAKVLDSVTVKTLLNSLSSADEREVLYAMDLLANTQPKRWRRHIQELIQHPSAAVRARTIALLAQWNDPSIAKHEFTRHPDYQTARIAMASALSLHWTGSGRSAQVLDDLLRDPSTEVCRQAIRTAGLVKHERAIPVLIRKLADNRLRQDARAALLQFGSRVVPELAQRLADPAEDLAVRRRIPKALAFIGKQRAADALMHSLHQFDYHFDYVVMKALNRMRVDHPDIVMDRDAVAESIAKENAEYERLRSVLSWLESNPTDDPVFTLLSRTVRERLEQRVERIFRLTALVYSPHDIYSVYYTCKLKPALRPSAVEFLDNIIEGDFKPVVRLVEEVFEPEKAMTEREPVTFISRDAVLETLAGGNDPWLKTIANHAGNSAGPSSTGEISWRGVG